MKDKDLIKKLAWIAFLRNCISLICFTILAIVFEKWWIVFFALLFCVSFEVNDDDER